VLSPGFPYIEERRDKRVIDLIAAAETVTAGRHGEAVLCTSIPCACVMPLGRRSGPAYRSANLRTQHVMRKIRAAFFVTLINASILAGRTLCRCKSLRARHAPRMTRLNILFRWYFELLERCLGLLAKLLSPKDAAEK